MPVEGVFQPESSEGTDAEVLEEWELVRDLALDLPKSMLSPVVKTQPRKCTPAEAKTQPRARSSKSPKSKKPKTVKRRKKKAPARSPGHESYVHSPLDSTEEKEMKERLLRFVREKDISRRRACEITKVDPSCLCRWLNDRANEATRTRVFSRLQSFFQAHDRKKVLTAVTGC